RKKMFSRSEPVYCFEFSRYIEAFANIYRNFARTVRARREGREPQPEWTDFPSVEDGIRGMQFIETMVRSGSDPDRKWTDWVG
ncbi:MAG: hypothetical protein KH248_02985, partial [Alistipes indistinctus]|nr:hypothetical protein [Alistipes indistinctus]